VSRGAFLSRTNVPKADFMTWTVLLDGASDPVDIKIPWNPIINDATQTWTSKDDYWKNICAQKASNLDSIPKRPKRFVQPPVVLSKETVPVRQLLSAPTKGRKSFLPSPPVVDPKPLTTGPGFAFFMAPDDPGSDSSSKTGVFVMTEFGDSGTDDSWKKGMIAGLDALIKNGAQNLILDLSNNGGGDICTAKALMQLISPDRAIPFLTDIRLASPVKELITTAFQKNNTDTLFTPSFWLDKDSKLFSDLKWIEPARSRVLPDGLAAPVGYSQFFRDNCNFSWDNYTLPFDLGNIAFVTNGLCLSSCSLVYNQLFEFVPEVETIATTAYPDGVGVTASTLTGGQVYYAASLHDDVADIGVVDPSLDMNLPLKGSLSFAFREAYSRISPDTVLEYQKRDSNYRLPYSKDNTLKVDALWAGVKNIKGWGGASGGDGTQTTANKTKKTKTKQKTTNSKTEMKQKKTETASKTSPSQKQ